MAAARKLVEAGRLQNEFRMDRRGLPFFIAASSMLHQLLDASNGQNKAAAEAYYLLGVSESMTTTSFWLSQTAYYLEASIRQDPASPFARKALALLEEETVLDYSGRLGRNISR